MKSKRLKLNLPEQIITYQSGGEGCIKWCNTFAFIPVYIKGMPAWVRLGDLSDAENPDTGRSSKYIWMEQQKILKKALRMKNGKFLHRLIIFCWMRGDGKSLLACLVQLWKFFNFPRQQIMLGANSKDQVKFVHFDIMRDIILNSPKLLRIVGRRNVQEKEIKLKDKNGNIVSIIRSISSFSGIVSNISGYTFSEIFDMKKPKFFTQLDGSIRNVPNALGVIDSTVSRKDHVLYRMFDNYIKGLDPSTFFSYRCSQEAQYTDFWNPEMTQSQLNSYKTKFPPAEFDMYFKNTWESAANKMFDKVIIMAMQYIGFDDMLGRHDEIIAACEAVIDLQNKREKNADNAFMLQKYDRTEKSLKIHRCTPLKTIYNLSSEYNHSQFCTLDELNRLGDLYDTNFAIQVGIDRADPMKQNLFVGAKSIVSFIAKGLPGSRSNPDTYMVKDSQVVRFFYWIISMCHIERNDIDTIKEVVERGCDIWDGVETLCGERWGMWDIEDWCEVNNITFEPVTGSYQKQKECFSELYHLVQTGRLKSTDVGIRGVNSEDILQEELELFDHDHFTKFYGSPEKINKFGVQDDSVFSLGWGIYGGRKLGVDDFRSRTGALNMGMFFKNKELVGDY